MLSFGCSDSPTGFLPRKSCPQSLVDTLVWGSILDVVIAGDEGKDGKRARSKGPGGGCSALRTQSGWRRR